MIESGLTGSQLVIDCQLCPTIEPSIKSVAGLVHREYNFLALVGSSQAPTPITIASQNYTLHTPYRQADATPSLKVIPKESKKR